MTSIGYFNANVDNNDDYTITLFNDTAGTSIVRTILATDGVVTGGLENFTSNAALAGTYTYVPTLAFAPFAANRATVTTANGDNFYGIGEVQFFRAAATGAVPESATWAMMLVGFGAIGAATRIARKRSAVSFA